MKPGYIIMATVCVVWLVTAVAILIRLYMFGEDWVNEAYMKAFLIFGASVVSVFGMNVIRHLREISRKK